MFFAQSESRVRLGEHCREMRTFPSLGIRRGLVIGTFAFSSIPARYHDGIHLSFEKQVPAGDRGGGSGFAHTFLQIQSDHSVWDVSS